MDALDLAVEDRVRIHNLSGGCLEPMDKSCLGLTLGCMEGFLEARISSQGLEFVELAEVSDPLVADHFRDCARQFGIRFQQPAARRNSVGLIVETLGKHFS